MKSLADGPLVDGERGVTGSLGQSSQWMRGKWIRLESKKMLREQKTTHFPSLPPPWERPNPFTQHTGPLHVDANLLHKTESTFPVCPVQLSHFSLPPSKRSTFARECPGMCFLLCPHLICLAKSYSVFESLYATLFLWKLGKLSSPPPASITPKERK